MFAVIKASSGDDLQSKITAMGEALQGGTGRLQVWFDSALGVAAAGQARGIQQEDLFDRQPYLDGQTCFVSDGHVEDREELAQQLNLDKATLPETSDAELLFFAYKKFGPNLPQVVYGNYSFAAIHRQTGEVILSSDHLGYTQVLYSEGRGTFLAASQMASMLAHPDLSKAPDLTLLGLLLAPKMLHGRTSIKSVSLLEGGMLLRYRPQGGLSLERWWKVEELSELRLPRENDYVQYMLHLLEKSVARALSASDSANTQLSGGLDSTLVASIAARQLSRCGKQITAFTSVPEEGVPLEQRSNMDPDESPLTEKLVSLHPNMNLVLVRPNGRCFLDVMPEIHARSYTTTRNTSNSLWGLAMMRQTMADGRRVILSGAKGNAVLSLEGRSVLNMLFQEGRWRTGLRLSHSDGRFGGLPAWKALGHELRWRYQHSRKSTKKLQDRPGAYLLSKAFREQHKQLLDQRVGAMRHRADHIHFATLGVRFAAYDSMSQMGMETRDPLGDRRLIEASLSLPLEAHFAGGRSRGLARAMGEGLVPDSIRFRYQRGSQSPETAGIIHKHAARYQQALSALHDSAACRMIFDLHAAERLMARLSAGQGSMVDGHTIERLIDAGTFLRTMGV